VRERGKIQVDKQQLMSFFMRLLSFSLFETLQFACKDGEDDDNKYTACVCVDEDVDVEGSN
jgi:hypothetical protein